MAVLLADFWKKLPIMDGEAFQLDQAMSRTVSRGGRVLLNTGGTPRWHSQINLQPAEHARSIDTEVDIGLLRGYQEFEAYDPRRPYPAYDPDGSIIGSNTVTINSVGADNRSLSFAGLKPSYKLTRGDYFQFTRTGGKRAYLRISETVIANGSGVTTEFDVEPFLPSGTTTGLVIALKEASGIFIMTPGSLGAARAEYGISSGIGFSIEESR